MVVDFEEAFSVFLDVDAKLAEISLADEGGGAFHEAFGVGQSVALDREQHADDEALQRVVVEVLERLLDIQRASRLLAVTVHHSARWEGFEGKDRVNI